MQIKNLYKINNPNSKVKAFFSIETTDFIINDCKIVDGSNGLFVAFPSREYEKDGEKKWKGIVRSKDRDVSQRVNALAIGAYRGEKEGSKTDDLPEEDIPF
jgi:DNA-binding cell septation regulator SpoVG